MKKPLMWLVTIILTVFVISCGTSRPAINIEVAKGNHYSIGLSDYTVGYSKGLIDKIQGDYFVNVVPSIDPNLSKIQKFTKKHYIALIKKYNSINDCRILGDINTIGRELSISAKSITDPNAVIILIASMKNKENESYSDKFEFYCTSDFSELKLIINSRNWMSNINSYIRANAMSDLLVGVKGHSYTQEAIDESVPSAKKAQFMIGVNDTYAKELF